MSDEPNTAGRERNAAEPLGEFSDLGSKQQIRKTGKAERRSAWPDGPDAAIPAEEITGTGGDEVADDTSGAPRR